MNTVTVPDKSVRDVLNALKDAKQAKADASRTVALLLSLPFFITSSIFSWYVVARMTVAAFRWFAPPELQPSGRLIPIVAAFICIRFAVGYKAAVKADKRPVSDMWAQTIGEWVGLWILFGILWGLHHFQ
jgi:hypothetical protein